MRVLVSNDWVCAGIAEEIEKIGFDTVLLPKSVSTDAANFDTPEWRTLLADADIIVSSPYVRISRAMMEAAPKLRGVMSAVIGVEGIDLDAAADLGLIVGHGAMPENFLGMAEATVLFILAQTLQMRMKERLLQENLPRPNLLTARLLRGQIVGLIGLGRIGRAVVDRLQGWEIELKAYDPFVKEPYRGTKLVELPELLASSDIVSLHVTLTKDTYHLMNEAAFKAMKPTAYFINTARGAAVDEKALHKALKEKWIAGAALDTFEIEPLPRDSALREFVHADNVVLTPHIIGHTKDVMDAIPYVAAENVKRVANGELPLYTKNPEVEPAWRKRLRYL
jgi:D-3-phosphoglycerate dehydrogenase